MASATGVEGTIGYIIFAYGIFDIENEDIWKWFMEQLHRAIRYVPNLVICTNASKGLEKAVGVVFPNAEYRECMRYLYQNFMKHYTGDVFTNHLYPAARSYTTRLLKTSCLMSPSCIFKSKATIFKSPLDC